MNTRNRAQVSRKVSVAWMGMFAVCLALAAGTAGAGTVTVTDDFSTSHDYLTAGVSGTIWDGVYNQSAANVLNTTGTAGQLTIGTTTNGAVGWEGTKATAPFLYKSVTGDFDARVQVTAGTTANYTIAGLLVRLNPANADGDAGEDFVMVTYKWFNLYNGLVSVNNNAQTETQFTAGGGKYLRLTRTGNVFNGYTSSDGTTWTKQAWFGGSTDLTRADLGGTVQLGLIEGAFVITVNPTWVRFDNFSLTTTNTATTTTLASSANPSTVGDSVTFTATIAPASGAVVPTGSVQFMTNGVALGAPVTVTTGTSPTGTASIATSALPVGTHTVTAVFTATGTFDDSTGTLPGGQSVTLPAVGTTTTLALRSPWTSSSTYGDALQFDVTVTGANPSGTVKIRNGGFGGTEIGTGTLSGGSVTVTVNPLNALTVGSYANIVAVYLGDSGNASSTSTALGTQTVAKKALTIPNAAAQNKTDNGNNTATLTGTLAGVVSPDSVTLTLSGTFADANPGINKPVTSTSTIDATSQANYTLTQPTGLTASIVAVGAANYTNSVSGNWSAAGSWTGSAPPTGGVSEAVIVFKPTAIDNSINDLSGAFWLNQLNVVPNYAVNLSASGGNSLLFTKTSGGTLPSIANAGTSTLTLNTPITLATNLTINAVSGGAITITSNITDGALGYGITSSGAGTLTLSGANTLSAGLTSTGAGTTWLRDNTMNLGTVMLNKNNGAGNVLNLTNVTLTSGPVTIGALWNNGDIVNLYSNTQWNAASLDMPANSNAKLTINGGATLNVTNGFSLRAGGIILNDGSTVSVCNSGISKPYWDSASLCLNGGSLVISNCPTAINPTGNPFTVTISNGTVMVINCPVAFGGGGGGAVSQYGGTVIIHGNAAFDTSSTYNMPTYAISGGSLILTNGAYIPALHTFTASGNAVVSVGTSGNQNNFGGTWSPVVTITDNAQVTFASPLRITYVYGSSFSATLNLSGGVLTVPAFTTSTGTGTGTVNFNGGTLRFSANNTVANYSYTVFNVLAGGAVIDSSAVAVTNNQALLNGTAGATDGGLTKLGTGSLTLGANNTYKGSTTISNGTLRLLATGSISNSAVINVTRGTVFDVSAYTSGYTLTNNQILAGNGGVTGAVVVASGAGVSGGGTNDVGTLTCANNLTLNAGAKVYWNYSGTTQDLINVTGTLNLPTMATVNVSQVTSGTLPNPAVLFTFATGAGVAAANGTLGSWVINGAPPSTRIRVLNNQVIMDKPLGTLIRIF
ncbi:MAG: Ig-like domain repeat protein [bacterium]